VCAAIVTRLMSRGDAFDEAGDQQNGGDGSPNSEPGCIPTPF
jgi:hypothetical protein